MCSERRPLCGTVAALVLFLLVPVARAQHGEGDIYWHIDPSVESCSMVIDSALTQSQWRTFTREAGAILSFKSLASAETLGKMNFKVAIDRGSTPVDQHDLAWINTFTHPDEDCPLGDVINIPTLRASMGVTNNLDIDGYWTYAPGANYGGVGAALKYAFVQNHPKLPTVAARASVSMLTGVPDFNFQIYSLEVLAGKKIAMLTPYVGLRQNLFVATETTDKVDLRRERLAVPQGYAGLSYSVWVLTLAAEYNVSSVNTFAIAVGFNL